MKTKLTRIIALVCCAVLLLGTGTATVSAATDSAGQSVSFFQSIADFFKGLFNIGDAYRVSPTLIDNFKLLSYKIDSNGVFYTEHEPWQKQFGFNQLYDRASPFIQLVYGTVRIKFNYDYVYKLDASGKPVLDKNKKPVYDTDAKGNKIPKSWLIQMWKGRYGLVLIGGEIGVYTKPQSQTGEHYYSAVDPEMLVMAEDIYQKDFSKNQTKYLFTRGPESTWWLTGFVPGNYHDNKNNNVGKDEVIMVANIEFPAKAMLDIFIKELEKAGFKKGAPGRDNPEKYVTSGNAIKISWQYIDQDKK